MIAPFFTRAHWFDDARAKFGLGEASAGDYNKFNRDRTAYMANESKQETAPFNPQTYVENTLKRQGTILSGDMGQGGGAGPAAQQPRPADPSGDETARG